MTYGGVEVNIKHREMNLAYELKQLYKEVGWDPARVAVRLGIDEKAVLERTKELNITRQKEDL